MNYRNQKGGALLMMVMVMLIMTTMLGIASMQGATMQVRMSKSFQDGVTAFSQAENGLAETKGRLIYDQTAARVIVDDIVANGEFTFCNGAGLGTTGVACPDNAMDYSRYDVTLDNYTLYTPTVGGVPAAAPTLRFFDITSVGTTTTNAIRTVRSKAASPFMDLPTGAALSLFDTGDVRMNGNPEIRGEDTSVPANENCNGGGCAGSANPFGTDTVGLYSEDATNQILNGNPSITGSPAVQVGGATLDSAYWAEWASTAGALADARNGSNWGTRANPVVHVIDGDLAVMGNTDGFGILIVNGANLAIGGNFHFEGIILVLADTAASVTMGGTSRVFGSMVVVGPNADINYTGGGTPEIMYSSEALMQLTQNQSWKVRGWVGN